MNTELTIVMPVYNEEEIIQKVITDWYDTLTKLEINFKILAINDGSKDKSLIKLNEIKASLKESDRLEVIDKKNSGHGPTILLGYNKAKDSEWIFQIDSDDELLPTEFGTFWRHRHHYDFLIGKRRLAERSLPRLIISLFTRLTVWVFYGGVVIDTNIPYRLMRASFFKDLFSIIPTNTFAPNVIVSGFAGIKNARVFQKKIDFSFRKTGVVSIQKLKLLKASINSFIQTISFRISL